jgi:hypothetical protein
MKESKRGGGARVISQMNRGPYQRRSPRAGFIQQRAAVAGALSAGLKNDLILGKKKADAWRHPSLTPATSSLMRRTPKLLIEVLATD